MKLRLFNEIISPSKYKSSITQEIQIILNIINNKPSLFSKKKRGRQFSFTRTNFQKINGNFLKSELKIQRKNNMNTSHLKVNIRYINLNVEITISTINWTCTKTNHQSGCRKCKGGQDWSQMVFLWTRVRERSPLKLI